MQNDDKNEFGERVLDDNYPVYLGYLYVVDGSPRFADKDYQTVGRMKKALGACEIRNCELYKRQKSVK